MNGPCFDAEELTQRFDGEDGCDLRYGVCQHCPSEPKGGIAGLSDIQEAGVGDAEFVDSMEGSDRHE